jgi:tetratricopeptide (TPR) repeat protein
LLAFPALVIPGCAELKATLLPEPGAQIPAASATVPPARSPAVPPEAPPAKPPAAPALRPGVPPVAALPPVSAADKAFAGGLTALRDGEYERALDLFSAAWKEKPGHPEISQGFDEALFALKKTGDAAYAQGKPEDAGKRWMGTLRYLNNPAAKGKTYPFNRGEVQGQVDRLTAGQMGKGLLHYRKGDIPAAIAAWKTILAYDPENEEAARSIRTASTQLENLKKIPPAK